jgi:NTE family protein
MTRALVLGGGGPVGIGWESGLAVGLANGGVDLSAADAIYGTSAGSFVGAQLALGFDIAATAALLLETSARAVVDQGSASITQGLQALNDVLRAAVVAGTPPDEVRRLLGPLAVKADVVSEEDFVGLFNVLRGQQWPEPFHCTAVDTATGEFVVWKSGSGADLQRAVASSCAVPMVCPPITIGERRYMDGGVRSPLNADLASGHDRVVVVSVTVLSQSSFSDSGLAQSGDLPGSEAVAIVPFLNSELSTLRSSGSLVEVIEPSAEFLEVSGWGASLMDPSKAGEAFMAGARQGQEESRRIARLWEG